jgi:hypothetical protein
MSSFSSLLGFDVSLIYGTHEQEFAFV